MHLRCIVPFFYYQTDIFVMAIKGFLHHFIDLDSFVIFDVGISLLPNR